MILHYSLSVSIGHAYVFAGEGFVERCKGRASGVILLVLVIITCMAKEVMMEVGSNEAVALRNSENEKLKEKVCYGGGSTDAGEMLSSWPPKLYTCSFCKRRFNSAQALGCHMNVHRRARTMLRSQSISPFSSPLSSPLLSNRISTPAVFLFNMMSITLITINPNDPHINPNAGTSS